MKQREKMIPAQGVTRIPEALDRVIEFYTATNKPDDIKKWQAERREEPRGRPAAGREEVTPTDSTTSATGRTSRSSLQTWRPRQCPTTETIHRTTGDGMNRGELRGAWCEAWGKTHEVRPAELAVGHAAPLVAVDQESGHPTFMSRPPHQCIRGPARRQRITARPLVLMFLGGPLVDLGFDKLILPQADIEAIVLAFCSEGVRVPGTPHKLRHSVMSLFTLVEPAAGNEVMLPTGWREMVRSDSWIGKKVVPTDFDPSRDGAERTGTAPGSRIATMPTRAPLAFRAIMTPPQPNFASLSPAVYQDEPWPPTPPATGRQPS